MKSGVLVLNKEAGMTSHDAVARVRRLFGTRQVGHTGTLDPNAIGVLPILVGNAVKAASFLGAETKIYRAAVRFGVATDTEDVWGKVLRTDPRRPTADQIEAALPAFRGEILQTPPMVSAVKIGGKKLYEYAREGKTVPRAGRPVTVHSFILLDAGENEASFRCEVSRGTYIRTLLCDLCAAMGVLGAMSALEREQSGPFSLSEAVTLGELERLSPEEREKKLIPVEALFSDLPVFALPPYLDHLIASGCRVLLSKFRRDDPVGARFRLYRFGAFFAIGEVIEEDGEKKLFKIKEFAPDA